MGTSQLAFLSAVPDRLDNTAVRVTLSLSLAGNAFYPGAKSQDVILSADVPGRHSSTTRQRRQCHLL